MNKPLKRHPYLVGFSKDHHFGLLLVWKIRQGLKKSIQTHRIAHYTSTYGKEALLPHFLLEEQYLIPMLAENDPLRLQTEKEHAELRRLLEEIEHGENRHASLRIFVDTLEAHIRFEERILFPHIQQTVDLDDKVLPAELEEQDRNQTDNGWDDPFWEQQEKRDNYETASEAVNDLIKRGYTEDFSIYTENDCLICNKTSVSLSPEDFEIDEIHRFEGMTDPGDGMIVYAISSPRYDIKGVVVNATGIYADATTSKIIQYLQKHQ